MTDEEKKYAKKMVEIYPPDPNAEAIFEMVVAEIRAAIKQEIDVVHMGSSKLGVSGQNEIDVYIPVLPDQFANYLLALRETFGEPRSTYPLQRVRFSIERIGKHIDLFLINELSEDWAEGLMFESYMLRHPEALVEYEQFKQDSVGLNMQEYYRIKKEFINDIRDRDAAEKKSAPLSGAVSVSSFGQPSW